MWLQMWLRADFAECYVLRESRDARLGPVQSSVSNLNHTWLFCNFRVRASAALNLKHRRAAGADIWLSGSAGSDLIVSCARTPPSDLDFPPKSVKA